MHIHERLGTLVAGRYRLRRIIGEGGMGAVFEAEVVPSGQRVAVKLIKPEYSSSQEVNARFVQEARAAASIGHPNIPAVIDAGTDDEGPYLVLELLKGETLADLLDRRPAGPREALAIAAETVDALRAAHAVGVVHRDIKPENIFLVGGADARTSVKLLDFGISKILHEQAMGGGLTRVGTAVGTPDYMSPEQASGNRVDGRADLWSLGAVMYEAISLKTPFTGDSYQQLLSRILLHPHEPLMSVVPAVHPEVSALIDRALQKEPAKRFPDAAAMHAEILRILAMLPADETLGMRADDSTGPFGSEATRVYDVHGAGVRARRRSRAGSSGTKEALVAPPPEAMIAPPVVAASLPPAAMSLRMPAMVSLPPMPPPPPMSLPPGPRPSYHPEPQEFPAGVAQIGAEAPRPRRALIAVAALGTTVLVIAALFTLRVTPPAASTAHLSAAPEVGVDSAAPAPLPALAPPSISPDAGALPMMPAVQQVLQSPPPREAHAPRPERAERTEPLERASRSREPSSGRGAEGTALNSSEFLAAVSSSTSRMSRCLHGEGGTVDVNVVIDARGRLAESAFRRPPQGSDEADCIARALRGVRFPRNRPTTTRFYTNVR